MVARHAPAAGTSDATPTARLLDPAAARLTAVTDAPRREAGRLLAHALGFERRSDVHLARDLRIDADARARFDALVDERARGVPLQYVLGYVDFYESRFAVRRGVFIPRPETETLVAVALALAPLEGRVLDLCTGSGAVVASLLAERADLRATAVDASAAALSLARANAESSTVQDRLSLLEGDLFAPVPAEDRFDLIVANPPYVAESDDVPPDVRDHEPHLALFGGPDGLDVIRRIIRDAPRFLRKGGALALEIGETQGGEVRELLGAGGFAGVRIRSDLGGRDRVATGRWALEASVGVA